MSSLKVTYCDDIYDEDNSSYWEEVMATKVIAYMHNFSSQPFIGSALEPIEMTIFVSISPVSCGVNT